VQSGNSIVDVYVHATGGSWLVGEFLPPEHPAAGQRFSLWLEDDGGFRSAQWSWSPGWRDRFQRRRSFRLPLGASGGARRLRLFARGQGPPGGWQNLALSGETSKPERADSAPRPSPPRIVVLYVLDALRADLVAHLGGAADISPTLDRLAREGVVFARHHSVAPNTLPATKSLFLGQAFRSRGSWPLPGDGPPTLPERIRAAGYRTALFSGNIFVTPAFGLDRGFDHVAEEALFDDSGEHGAAGFNNNAEQVHAAALAWLRTLKQSDRAFLYLHTIHPHNPYDPPEPLRSRFTAGIDSEIDGATRTLIDLKRRRRAASPADQKRLRGLYAASFAYNDAELAKFLAELQELVAAEDLFLAVTSDHGEELFDHGGVLHGYTLYQEMLHIPLVLWSPGRLRPEVVEQLTDTLDLGATLLDLVGAAPPPGSQARSLLEPFPTERGEVPVRFAAAASLRGGMFSARSNRWKVVWAPRRGRLWGMGEDLGRSQDPEYLFDLQQDPNERINVAGQGDLEAAWLRSRLLAWAGQEVFSPTPGAPAEIDEQTRDRLRALGYTDTD
jgi:arylsulfatase A-like enzyme